MFGAFAAIIETANPESVAEDWAKKQLKKEAERVKRANEKENIDDVPNSDDWDFSARANRAHDAFRRAAK